MVPGDGTIRRWLREAPKGFAFTVLAPKDIAAAGFEVNSRTRASVMSIGEIATQLKAQAVVFVAGKEFVYAKKNKDRVRSFLETLPNTFPRVVFDFSAWTPSEVAKTCESFDAVAAYDPREEKQTPASKHFVYLRLPGPAGHRSRYDEASIEQIAEHCRSLSAKTVFCIFRNIDMHTNGVQLGKKLRT